ncbi:MAG: T9SS type A sorting domain-containing protein [Phaeodactylibacter sp.]|nr:T9SS type A sorting domain-containing protein [Phaeodactylibacter sp.]
MRRLAILILILSAGFSRVEAGYGFYANCGTFIEIEGEYYKVGACTADDPAFNGVNLGANLTKLVVTNIQQYTYQNGGDDVVSGFFHYRVYPVGGTAGSFSQIQLDVVTDLGGGNERREAFINLDLLLGLQPGLTYNLDAYFRAQVDWNPTNGTPDAEFFESNGGSNFTATFSTSATLPVELSHFSAKAAGPSTLLSWSTATETNNAHFEVQRSAGSRDWEVIGKVKGAGTTQEAQHYTYADHEPLSGLSYYRLRQVDYDGQYAFSPVVAVDRKEAVFSFTAFPNPAPDVLYISLPAREEPLTAEVYDACGRRVRQQTLPARAARQEIHLSGLPPGLYCLAIADGQGRRLGTGQFVKR